MTDQTKPPAAVRPLPIPAGAPTPGRLNHAHAAPSREEIRRARMDEDSGQRADDREGRDVS